MPFNMNERNKYCRSVPGCQGLGNPSSGWNIRQCDRDSNLKPTQEFRVPLASYSPRYYRRCDAPKWLLRLPESNRLCCFQR